MVEFPCLAELVSTAEPAEDDGQRLVWCLSKVEAEAVLEVATGLFAVLLALLCNFIGERMVWQIVRSAFPAIDMTGLKERE
jgi:uncharacterized Tic20 family protein